MSARRKAPAAVLRDQFQLTGAAFDGGEDIRQDATAADMFSLLFAAPNAHDNFLEQVLCCVSDDIELIQAAAASDYGLDSVIVRVSQRNHFRIKVALEVSRRMAAAAKAGAP